MPVGAGTVIGALHTWFHLLFTVILEERYLYHVFPGERMSFGHLLSVVGGTDF